MERTILITGGAGFIGSNFVSYVAKKYPNYKIIVLDALTYAGSMDTLPEGFRELEHPQFKFWYGNVCNAELVDALVQEADYIVHFAAETHVTRSIFDNLQFFQTDIIGTHTVANAVLKGGSRVKRLVHISTSEVYGNALTEAMSEDHPLNPMSPYASAKCGADRLVYSYWTTYGVPAVIVRPFNNFGPAQHLEKVIPRFISSAILGEDLFVHGQGRAARDFVFVEDVLRGIDLVLHADGVEGEVFNIASGQHRSVLDIAHAVAEVMDYDPGKIKFTGDRPGQVLRHTGDYSKIEKTLNWRPEVSWEDGLARTIEWYKNNPEWWKRRVWMRSIPIINADGVAEYH